MQLGLQNLLDLPDPFLEPGGGGTKPHTHTKSNNNNNNNNFRNQQTSLHHPKQSHYFTPRTIAGIDPEL